MRTATEDTVVPGVPIAKGESVYPSYVSANRDEEVFDEPFRFGVARNPNKHLAFGFGVHFSLGAGLARREVGSFFAERLSRLKSIELNGEPASSPPSSAASRRCRFDTLAALIPAGPKV